MNVHGIGLEKNAALVWLHGSLKCTSKELIPPFISLSTYFSYISYVNHSNITTFPVEEKRGT